MTTALDNEEDLQSYFNSLNKDMDEATDSMELAEAVKTLTGEDGEEGSPKILAESGSDKETFFFLDQDENYILPSSPVPSTATTTLTRRKSQRVAQSTQNTPSTSSNAKKLVATVSTAKDAAPLNDDEDADTGDTKYHIYEFDEEDEEKSEDNDDDADFIMPTKSIKLKPNTDANVIEYKCSYCKFTTPKKYMLKRHFRIHSDERPFKCLVCENGFKTNSALQHHLNTHLGNKPHACKDCEMAFTTPGELTRHRRYRHTGEKPHKCSECDYSSVELSKLRRHIRCHTGERPYQCPHCTYASPDTFKLKRHMRTHTGEKPYECEICHSRFTQSNSLKAHRLIHSVVNKPVYPCALCPTTCGRKTDLRLHVQKLHHSDHPIRCKRCDKDLPDRYSYKVHIKSHEGEKCHRCTLCPYASTSMRHLESHMLVHSDEKPFACKLCNISFRQQQLLKRHNNLYHNKSYVPPVPRAKAHACPHCKRTFTHKGNMLRHMEVHDPLSNIKMKKLDLKIRRSTRITAKDKDASGGKDEDDEQDVFEEDDNIDEDGDYEEKVEGAEGDEGDIFTDTFEIIEMTEEEDFDNKAIVKIESSSQNEANSSNSFTNRPIKHESRNKIVAVKVDDDDDEQYMVVEVIQCEDDEEDEDDDRELLNIATTNIKQNATNDIDNCFGVQDNSKSLNREFIVSADEKDNIQLLDIIDDI